MEVPFENVGAWLAPSNHLTAPSFCQEKARHAPPAAEQSCAQPAACTLRTRVAEAQAPLVARYRCCQRNRNGST